MKRKIEKHMPYFDVLEALAKATECALCVRVMAQEVFVSWLSIAYYLSNAKIA
jgi:hypothetical protein